MPLDRHLAAITRQSAPQSEEESYCGGEATPVWSHHGIVCTGEAYTKVVKLTFARGAALQDPDRLFNSSLEGNVRRAIDIHEGEKFPEASFKQLVKAAVAKNLELAKGR